MIGHGWEPLGISCSILLWQIRSAQRLLIYRDVIYIDPICLIEHAWTKSATQLRVWHRLWHRPRSDGMHEAVASIISRIRAAAVTSVSVPVQI
mmetsp:Transcript_30939/g.51247  ORF Transcript_30939/g.51247 Transcript_30939/m.51247 type:complete len:93 (-) Transcript_30939:1014-1292(-)